MCIKLLIWTKVPVLSQVKRLPEEEQFGHVGHCVGHVRQCVVAPVDEEEPEIMWYLEIF